MTRSRHLILLALLAACIPVTPPPTAPPATVERPLRVDPQRRPSRVVLLSHDGVGADELRRHEANGVLSENGYRLMAREGLTAERVVPVNPTLTSPAHISIATGARAEKTGIVSNSFHVRGTPRTEWTSGFDAPIDVETLWEAAKRQGKRVGTVTFPGLDGNGPRRSAEWGLVYSHPLTESKRIVLRRSDFKSNWYPPGWTMPEKYKRSFSPVLQATLVWEVEKPALRKDVDILAFDRTDDKVENYDELKIIVDDAVEIPFAANRWFAISSEVRDDAGSHVYGSWSKILETDPELSRTVIYWGRIGRNIGYPESYRTMIDREVGFWPGPPDDDLIKDWLEQRGGIDPATYTEQLVRFSRFFTEATRLSIERMEFDLLLAYQPIVDEAEHQFRIVDPRQLAYSERNAAIGEDVRRAAYRAFDESLTRVLPVIKSSDALVVTGDHGHLPIDTTVYLSQLLIDWGFAKEKDGRIATDTPWASFTSAGVAHIYAFESVSDAVRLDLMNRLRALRTPEGDPVFEIVRTKTAQDHRNTGDIVAVAHTRFVLSSSISGKHFAPANHYGQHGGLNHHAGLHTFLVARGSGVVPGKVGTIQQTEIARYVSELLGIDAPKDAE